MGSHQIFAAGPYVAPTAFSPSDIPGLALWLDAGTLGLSDGDPVASWTDLSGNANHAVQAIGGKQPVLKTGIINGLDVVRFDGADDVLISPTPVSLPCSCFIVCAPNAAAGSQIPYAIWVLTAGIWISTRLSGTANWGSFLDSSGEQDSTETLVSGTPVLLEQTCAISFPSILYRDGVVKDNTASFVASVANTNVQIGADDGPSRFVNGDIAEAVLYDTVLSTGDRNDVEDYLMMKYAI